MIKASYIEVCLLMAGIFFFVFANYDTASVIFLTLITLLFAHLLYKSESEVNANE